jgi:hypothetical protein
MFLYNCLFLFLLEREKGRFLYYEVVSTLERAALGFVPRK